MRTRFIFFLYRAAQRMALPFLLLYVLWRIVRDIHYSKDLSERFGFWRLPNRTAPGSIWLHAVSVGEALSCVELLTQIRAHSPGISIYVSCGTLAGKEVAEKKLRDLVNGVFFAPIDYCFAVRRVLRAIKPSVLVVMETEIWPNLYRETRRSGASVVVVNGRISDKAIPKYRNIRWFFSAVFPYVNSLLVQSAQDKERYLEAGAIAEQIRVAGNLKYDFQPNISAPIKELREILRRPLWIAASTVGPVFDGDIDEDDVVLSAFIEVREKHPDLQLLMAPRKPERFDVVADKLSRTDLSFVLRSTLPAPAADVVLLDSIGELSSLFAAADVVFMGGTLASRGGHNILEPALFGKPVVAGPHLENFAAIRDRFRSASAYLHLDGPAQLVPAIEMLLSDVGFRESLGARAKALAETERGATARARIEILQRRSDYVPRTLYPGPVGFVLSALSWVWRIGTFLKFETRKRRALATPVVSVGGLAMGGVGKTPMVCWLADALRFRGYRPAILTRGYGRQSREPQFLERGSTAPVEFTGDEAQVLLRFADVGIGANRWAVGLEMEQRFHPDVFLLDDGFQHRQLRRDFDLVLLDGLDPLAGGGVFPLGRLREPVTALRRADAVLITRSAGNTHQSLRSELPRKPMYFAGIAIEAWRPQPPAPGGVAAFCGLANPETFFRTLQEARVQIAFRRTFPDHHRYQTEELIELAADARSHGASAIVTTEKDWANLPPNAAELVAPLIISFPAVRPVVVEGSSLLDQIEAIVRQSVSG